MCLDHSLSCTFPIDSPLTIASCEAFNSICKEHVSITFLRSLIFYDGVHYYQVIHIDFSFHPAACISDILLLFVSFCVILTNSYTF